MSTEFTKGTGPLIDKVLFTVGNDGILWTYGVAIITRYAKVSYFNFDLSHPL